jgi:hypothetical protein
MPLKILHYGMSQELDDGGGRNSIDDIPGNGHPSNEKFGDTPPYEGGDAADDK